MSDQHDDQTIQQTAQQIAQQLQASAKPLMSEPMPESTTEQWRDQSGSIFLSEAPVSEDELENFETINNIRALDAAQDWELYPTRVDSGVQTLHEGMTRAELPSFSHGPTSRTLDAETAKRLRQTFEALSSIEEQDAELTSARDGLDEPSSSLLISQEMTHQDDAWDQRRTLGESTDDELLYLRTLSGELMVEAELADDELEEILDPFMVTGLHMLEEGDTDPLAHAHSDDVEEILDPFSMTGFHLIEGEDEDSLEEWGGTLATARTAGVANPGTQVLDLNDLEALGEELDAELQAQLSKREPEPETTRQLRICLEQLGQRVTLRPPWDLLVSQLRAELLAEPDDQWRAASAYVLAGLMRLHGSQGQESARALESATAALLPHSRSSTVGQLVQSWRGPLPQFLSAYERLRAFDVKAQTSSSSLRHTSIVVGRLLDELLSGEPQQELIDLVAQRESISGLFAQALLAHRWGDRQVAARFWFQLSHDLVSHEREAVITLAAYLLREHEEFYALVLDQEEELGHPPGELQLILAQQVALKRGEPEREAQAIAYLVGDAPPEGTAQIWGAYVLRKAVLTRAWQPQLASDELWGALEHMSHLVAPLRLLWRWAIEDGSLEREAQALERLLPLYEEPEARALLRERLAFVRYTLSGDRDAWIEALSTPPPDAAQSLPALIMLGQEHLRRRDWSKLVELRQGPSILEASGLHPSWRRAELLERAGGDWREVLSLYRSARHDQPDDAHLFFCVERAYARQGQWRGLLSLFESTRREQPHLYGALHQAGCDLESGQLAIELYLDDVQRPSIERLRVDYEQRARRHGDDELVDEAIFWRLVSHEVQTRQIPQALAMVEDMIPSIDPQDRQRWLRASLWRVYLLGVALRQPKQCLGSYREILQHGQGTLLVRFAFHSLLRLGDFSWLAQLCQDDSPALEPLAIALWPQGASSTATRWLELAAELYAHDEEHERALACWEVLGDVGLARALGWSLSRRDWVLVQRLLPLVDVGDDARRQAHEGLCVQLNACRDVPQPLESLSVRISALATSPVHALAELESALRQRAWEPALKVIDLAVASTIDRRGSYRAMLTMLAATIAEWGLEDTGRAWRYLKAWSDLALEHGGEWEARWMLAAMHRVAVRLNKTDDATRTRRTVTESFGQPLAALFGQEAAAVSAAPDLESAIAWYQQQARQHSGESAQHLQVSAVILGWLFDERSPKLIQALSDAHSREPDALQLLSWLGALAHREAGMLASMERFLSELGQQHQVPELAEWAQSRELMHLATTLGCPEDALATARERLRDEPWLLAMCELLERATGQLRPQDAREPASRLALALQTQSATLMLELAEQGQAAAVLWAEVRAATERRDWRVDWNMELRHASLRRAVAQEPQEIMRQRFMELLAESDPATVESPWCPLRIIDYELGRLGVGNDQLDGLLRFAERAQERGVGAQVRLWVAQQLVRGVRTKDAISLIPLDAHEHEDALISEAWFWLAQALDVGMRHPRAAKRMVLSWRVRANARSSQASPSLRAALDDALGRALEVAGQDEDALAIYMEILARTPEFMPASVSASRILIIHDRWEDLAALWRAQLAAQPQPEPGLCYRLALLCERRLSEVEGALDEAASLYAQILAVQPQHEPSLLASLALSMALKRHDAAQAMRCLDALIERCTSRQLKASYHLESGLLCEQGLVPGPSQARERALEHYLEASALWPESADALLGVLRVEPIDGAHSVRLIEEHLARDVVASATLDSHLFLRASAMPRADFVMGQRFGDREVWRFVQLVEALERGELHDEAISVLRGVLGEEQLQAVLAHLEFTTQAEGFSAERLKALGEAIGERPFSEGLLLSMSARAHAKQELELMGMLARQSAQRASEDWVKAVELTWAAVIARWAGDLSGAHALCVKAHDRSPRFLPAVKLARLVAVELPDWKSLARWCTLESRLSHVPALAILASLEASDVYRRYLGDLGQAREHLEVVLKHDPTHEQAFEQLKAILFQQGAIPDLITLCEQRMPMLRDPAKRVVMLNELADLSLQALRDGKRAVRYLNMSLQLDPRQLRRLRVLAELYESSGQFEQAVLCYEAATQLATDRALVARMCLQIAQLYEHKLGQLASATKAYERVLMLEPAAEPALYALVGLYERQGQSFKSLEALDRLARQARSPVEHRRAIVAKLEVTARAGMPIEGVARATHEVWVHHPEHVMASGVLAERMRAAGRLSELEPALRQALHESLRIHSRPPLNEFYAHARSLGLADLGFSLAACSRWLGIADQEMVNFHAQANMDSRWPSKPIPIELSAGILPTELLVSFVEIIRRSSAGLLEASDPMPYAQHVKRRARLSQPFNVASQQAMRWPTLFGLEVKDTYMSNELLPLGCGVVMEDDGVRLILDEQWRMEPARIKLLVKLGTQLGAWSMGVGLWSALGREAQFELLLRIIQAVSPGWGGRPQAPKMPAWFQMDRFDRWLSRDGIDSIAPYALELSGSLTPQSLPAQFVILELAMERLGCVVLPDPYTYLTHTTRFGVEAGPQHRPWTAVLSSPVAKLRRAIGLAYGQG